MKKKKSNDVLRRGYLFPFLKSNNKGLNRPLIIILVTLVVIGILLLLLYLKPGFSSAGRAFYVEEKVTEAPGSENTFWLENVKTTAVQGDTITVPIRFRSAVPVGSAKFVVEYESDKFTPVSKVIGSGFSMVTSEGNWNTFLGDSSKGIDLMSTSGVSGNNQLLATISFRVDGVYDPTEKPLSLTAKILGFQRANPTANIELAVTERVMELTIVPACPDLDGDGYGSGLDLRGCGNNQFKADCDDEGNDDPEICPDVASDADCNNPEQSVCAKCILPGATEVCDGVDNNCNNNAEQGLDLDPATGVDRGLVGEYNSELRGVCLGNKICTGQEGWQDSYLVNPSDYGLQQIMFGGSPQQELYNSVTDDCDFFDNDCDGELNEDAVDCQIGGICPESGSCQTEIPGNLFFKFDQQTYVEGGQKIGLEDLTSNYLMGDFYNDEPLSHLKTSCAELIEGGFICICKNGNYYILKSSGDTFNSVTFVDYNQKSSTEMTVDNYKIDTSADGTYYGLFYSESGDSWTSDICSE